MEIEFCDMCNQNLSEHICAKTLSGKTLWAWVGEFNLVMFTEIKNGGECDDYVELPISFCPFCGRALQ